MVLQRRLRSGKENSGDAFIAGLVGGYWVFGNNNNINNQIVLYLFSRILVGLAKMTVKRGWLAAEGPLQLTWEQANSNDSSIFPVFASLVWAVVMWLFRHERDTLQPSLQASMQYLYNDSEKWDSLRNLLWHNK
jgi:peroxisomal membrane protein 4